MYGLDIFSGIGGITKALEGYVRPVAYCENDRYAQCVLLSRMGAGDLPRAPIWDDVRTLKPEDLPAVDIIYGGFPCQDISIAGRGEGLAGKRSGLFFEIVRLVSEIRPRFVFLENVPAIRFREETLLPESWPASGMTVDGTLYPLQTWERTISEKDGGYWRTPLSTDWEKSGWGNLPDQVRWPTPRANSGTGPGIHGEGDLDLQTAVKFATPQSRDFRTGEVHRCADKENHSRNLNDQVGGQLNPTWVEWLMNYPALWTCICQEE